MSTEKNSAEDEIREEMAAGLNRQQAIQAINQQRASEDLPPSGPADPHEAIDHEIREKMAAGLDRETAIQVVVNQHEHDAQLAAAESACKQSAVEVTIS